MKEKQTLSFITEALVISVSNLLVKIIGVCFRIPLTNILQGSIGVYSAAYSVYAMLYMVSTAGLPVAISRMISASHKLGREKEKSRIFKSSLLMFGTIGVVFTLIMYFGAETIAEITLHNDAAEAMKIISPTLAFICITSAIRGYFQGHRNMLPTAISQLIEAVFKLVLGIGAALYAHSQGYSTVIQASYAIFGIVGGTFVAMVFLIICRCFVKTPPPEILSEESDGYKRILKNMTRIAIPVTISSSALYFAQFFDTIAINNCLVSSGVSGEIAEDLYSAYTGLTLSLSDLLPATLIYPIAISILPTISASLAVKDYDRAIYDMKSSMRMTGIIAFPCAFGLAAVARPCITLIYGVGFGSEDEIVRVWNGNEYAPVDVASSALVILAVGIIFISMLSTTNALLQAADRQWYPMISIGVGVAVLIILEILLVSTPIIGIYGAPLASVGCYIAALTMNLLFMKKFGLLKDNIFKMFFRPCICGFMCGAAAAVTVSFCRLVLQSESRIASLISVLAAGAVGCATYIAFMLGIKGITAEEVCLLPKGKKLSAFLVKKGWLK